MSRSTQSPTEYRQRSRSICASGITSSAVRGSCAQLRQQFWWYVAIVQVATPPEAHAHDAWEQCVLYEPCGDGRDGFVEGDCDTDCGEQIIRHRGGDVRETKCQSESGEEALRNNCPDEPFDLATRAAQAGVGDAPVDDHGGRDQLQRKDPPDESGVELTAQQVAEAVAEGDAQ